jgi:hypothetical protein
MTRKTWHQTVLAYGRKDVPDGTVMDATPMPGCTYVRGVTWPPRGRGRGESLYSPRRVRAKLRACEVMRMRIEGHTWTHIAKVTGFASASGAYNAFQRCLARVNWDERRRAELKRERQ